MDKLLMVGGILFLVVCVVCACMESKVTAPYKWFHVYGRFKAYMAMDFTAVGIMLIVCGIFQPEGFAEATGYIRSPALAILGGLIIMVPGVLIYVRTAIKCPPFLRGRCVISMLITGFGVTVKISLFFLFFIWKIQTPEYVTLEDGRQYLNYYGDLYTTDGVCVGRRSGYNEFTVRKDEYGNPVRM